MRTEESILRDILRVFVWFPFRWILRILPVDLSFFLFKVCGNLHFCVSGEKKKKILRNVRNRLNVDKQALRIVKQCYELHYLDRLHIFLYPKLTTREKVKQYVHFQNLEVLDNISQHGRGVLLVQPHFGPVQITLLALALRGYDLLQIGYPTDKGLSKIGRSVAFKYRLQYEAMLPAPIISADKYLGKVYKHLKNGGIVLTTGDGAGGGVFLGECNIFEFLGIERKIPLGPATWALKTGAAYVPTFIIPEKYNRFRVSFENPIEGIYDDTDRNKVYITREFLQLTEKYIQKYPHCWHFWDDL